MKFFTPASLLFFSAIVLAHEGHHDGDSADHPTDAASPSSAGNAAPSGLSGTPTTVNGGKATSGASAAPTSSSGGANGSGAGNGGSKASGSSTSGSGSASKNGSSTSGSKSSSGSKAGSSSTSSANTMYSVGLPTLVSAQAIAYIAYNYF